MVERYQVKENDVEFEVVEVNLEPLYEFAPQATACQLLRTLAGVYDTLSKMLEDADIIVEASPDAGVKVEGDMDATTANAVTWIIDVAKNTGVDRAIEFVKQFEYFNESRVRETLAKIRRVLHLWDGYEHCYALKLKEVIKE